MPDCLSRTGWVRRRLARQELLTAADVPSNFHDDLLFQSSLLGLKALLGAPVGVLRLLGVSINLCFIDDFSSPASSRPPGKFGGLLPLAAEVPRAASQLELVSSVVCDPACEAATVTSQEEQIHGVFRVRHYKTKVQGGRCPEK
jgi:hypothetical protein